MQKTLPIHFAPLQGYTDVFYRNAHAACFGGIDTYYTPFVRLEKGGFRHRDVRGIEPGNNQVPHLIPQLIAPSFDKADKILSLFIEKGYKEVDINMGCPAPKISSNGSGSALMKNPRLCGEIVKAVTAVTDIPVTVKIRKGWDDDSVNAVEVAKICESAGAAAITVHGRTRQQYYKPPVDYDIIRAVRESVSVPVIANGDIDSAERAKEVMDITGCDLVMIGRATLGNPWIFSQINAYLENPNVKIHTPDLEERLGVMIEHIGKMVEYKGEHMAMLQARKLVVGYFKGMKGAAALRNEAGKIKTLDDLYELRQKALSLQ